MIYKKFPITSCKGVGMFPVYIRGAVSHTPFKIMRVYEDSVDIEGDFDGVVQRARFKQNALYVVATNGEVLQEHVEFWHNLEDEPLEFSFVFMGTKGQPSFYEKPEVVKIILTGNFKQEIEDLIKKYPTHTLCSLNTVSSASLVPEIMTHMNKMFNPDFKKI